MGLLLSWLVVPLVMAGAVTMSDGPEAYDGPAAYGGTLSALPGQHPPIRIEHQSFYVNTRDNQIRAKYVVRNEGFAAPISLSIPEYRQAGNGIGLERMWVWVDGRPVTVLRKRLPSHRGRYDSLAMTTPDALWIVRIPFRRGQVRTLRVSFISWGRGRESLLWLLYFCGDVQHDRVQTTDLNVHANGRGASASEYDVRLFLKGGKYETVPVRRKGSNFYCHWANWKPNGILMVVEDN